jgi:hypothetical protein
MPKAITSPSRAWSMSSAFEIRRARHDRLIERAEAHLHRACLDPGEVEHVAQAHAEPFGIAHRAVAPLRAGTRGWNSPRLLPEHWLTAAISTRGRRSSWARLIDSGRLTWPKTLRRKVSTSIEVGMSAQCQRTKNWSLGVNTDLSNTHRRFQQGRMDALEDHAALAGKGAGHRPLGIAAGQLQVDELLRQCRRGGKAGGAERGMPEKAATAGLTRQPGVEIVHDKASSSGQRGGSRAR